MTSEHRSRRARPEPWRTALVLGAGVPSMAGLMAFLVAAVLFDDAREGVAVALLAAFACAGSALWLSSVGIRSDNGRVGVALLAGVVTVAMFVLLTSL